MGLGRVVTIELAAHRRVELAAFLVVDIRGGSDEPTYARYREHVLPNLATAGGTYLVRCGQVETLEGNWRPNRIVVVRFESMQAARAWWNSAEYAELKCMRQRSTNTNMILVEGISNV